MPPAFYQPLWGRQRKFEVVRDQIETGAKKVAILNGASAHHF